MYYMIFIFIMYSYGILFMMCILTTKCIYGNMHLNLLMFLINLVYSLYLLGMNYWM